MPQNPEDPFARHSIRTSVYFPQTQLAIAGNPKAAGTSLRWWLLESHGIDVQERTRDSLWGESSPYQVVWDPAVDLRYTWQHLSEQERATAMADPGVLWVLPVRHPVSRAFSAWSGKYLVLEPGYHDRLPDGFDPAPERIQSAEHVRELFTRFVLQVEETVAQHGWEAVDVHFWPQMLLLGSRFPGDVAWLRQEDPTPTFEVMRKRLRAAGVEPLPMQRLNESVVPYAPNLVSDAACGAVKRLYEGDFDGLDYQAQAPPGTDRPVALEWLNDVRGRNRRYAVLHRQALQQRRRRVAAEEARDRAESEAAQLRELLQAAQRREQDLLESTSWRVTKPLRWASPARRHGDAS